MIREVLKTESVSRDTLEKLVGVSTARKLLETTTFTYRFSSREITVPFDSNEMGLRWLVGKEKDSEK